VNTILSISEAVAVVALGFGSVVFSRRSDKQTRAIGNGWTAGLGDRLDRQDAALARIESKVDRADGRMIQHLRDHWRHADDGK
jgi:N-acetylglucosamine kinase-like BadF-type ATPase